MTIISYRERVCIGGAIKITELIHRFTATEFTVRKRDKLSVKFGVFTGRYCKVR